jgi:hypothetical protein
MLYWAYWQISPWGEWRADLRIGQLCALIANANRDPKKRRKPFAIDDFMLFDQIDRKRKRQGQTGNLDSGLHDAFMALAGAAVPRGSVPDKLKRAAPHLPAETLAKLTGRIQRDGD